MSLWKKTGTVEVDIYRRKTVWDRIKAFLDGLAGVAVVMVIVIAIFG